MLPVVIINGPLGSGKTTLIHSLLKNHLDPGKSLWLKTEFGDENIDKYILMDTGVQTTELAGGCICHVLLSKLDGVLTQIEALPNIDLVIIETSGMTHPAPVTQAIERHPQFRAAHNALIVDVEHAGEASYPKPMILPMGMKSPYNAILFNKYDISLSGADERKLEEILDPWYAGVYTDVEKIKLPNSNSDADPYHEMVGVWYKQLKNDMQKAFLSSPKNIPNDAKLETVDAGNTEDHEGEMDVLSFHFSASEVMSRKKVEEYAAKMPDEVVRIKGVFHTESGKWEFYNWVRGDGVWSALSSTPGGQLLLVMGHGIESNGDLDFG